MCSIMTVVRIFGVICAFYARVEIGVDQSPLSKRDPLAYTDRECDTDHGEIWPDLCPSARLLSAFSTLPAASCSLITRVSEGTVEDGCSDKTWKSSHAVTSRCTGGTWFRGTGKPGRVERGAHRTIRGDQSTQV